MTFYQISDRPVIIEGQINHHLIHLNEMIRMSYGTAFYDYWMVRYLTKRQWRSIVNIKNADF